MRMTITTRPTYASAIDPETYGAYRIKRDSRPLYRFDGRISVDGSTGFRAESGRYHVYSGWFCPWAQRVVIVRALKGLQAVIGLSYVHGQRDGRGWAFREPTGPDPVNGFRLLRDAYEATQPGFDGHVSVPTLWDKRTGRIVSNTFGDITIDLATEFEQWSDGIDTYPVALRPQIDALNQWLLLAVNQAAGTAAGNGPESVAARSLLLRTLGELDHRLQRSRYLLGSQLTEADVRLWVTLVRYDVMYNAGGAISDRRLVDYPHLWAYARELYQRPAFRDSTDFAAFARSGVKLADWSAPASRPR
jgi:glutathionyl-hydroquinone reductase